MDVTREHISHILKLREMLLFFKTSFNRVNAAVVCAILVSSLGLEPLSVLLSPSSWSSWLSQAFVHLLYSLLTPQVLSSAWSSRYWSPCHRLCTLCRDAQLILPVLTLLLSHRCHQQSGDWWLLCLQCWRCLCDLLRRLSWSFPECLKEGGWELKSLSDSNCSSEPVSYVSAEGDCTGNLACHRSVWWLG